MFKAAYGAAFRIPLQPAMVFAIVGAPAAATPVRTRENRMRVMVTGATGCVGAHSEGAARRVPPWLLVRDPDKAPGGAGRPRREGRLDCVSGDMTDGTPC